MKVNIGKRARRQVERIHTWWRAHREKAPNLFKEELELAEAFLSSTPHFAKIHITRGKRTIRWVLLPKTHVKLYFWVDDNASTVNVVSVWGAKRGREPKL